MENNNDNDFTCCHCQRMFFNSLNDFRDHNTVAYAYYHVEYNLCQNVFSRSADLQTHRQQRRPPPPPAPARQQQEAAAGTKPELEVRGVSFAVSCVQRLKLPAQLLNN